jgi:lipopolysaccharide transport system permease protein
VISGAVTELFALGIFVAGLLIARGRCPRRHYGLPVLVIPQLLFTAGLCWFLAALGVFMRDLTQIIGFLLNLVFFLTPILYPDTALPEAARKVLGVNPVYILVRGYRAIFWRIRRRRLCRLRRYGSCRCCWQRADICGSDDCERVSPT